MSSHDTRKERFAVKTLFFKFKVDGITFVHMGDLGHNIDAETIEKLKDAVHSHASSWRHIHYKCLYSG